MGEERDPLLVRPFVLPDSTQQEPPPSASTWPVEQRAGEMPTLLLPTIAGVPAQEQGPGGTNRPRLRHTVLLAGAAAAAVSTVAGFAMLRPADPEDSWTSLPGQPLPAAIGPATSAGVTPSEPGDAVENRGGGPGAAGETTPSKRPSRTAPTSQAAGSASARPPASPPVSVPSTPKPVVPVAPIDRPPNPAVIGNGLLVTGNGLCLDLRGGQAADGAEVHIDDCNGTSPQHWTLNADSSLRVLGLCADLPADGPVKLTGCDGRTSAQWLLLGDGTLTNVANSRCLTDPFSGGRPGNAVIVTTCTGGNNQHWSFR